MFIYLIVVEHLLVRAIYIVMRVELPFCDCIADEDDGVRDRRLFGFGDFNKWINSF